jgi:hypothetical protein
MVIETNRTQQSAIPNTLNLKSAISSSTLESFEQQLSSAIDGYLASSGNGTQFEISVQPGTESGSLTINVTPGSSSSTSSTAATSTTATSAAAATTVASFTSTAETVPLGASAAPTTSSATASAAATAAASSSDDTSEMTPTDAYWAEQPAAVQALRYAPDDEKASMAQQLANEGYTIDVPIMVWGWDPLATMIQRQEDGYTWVPSALQPSVGDAPGVTMPGTTSYNPNDPPAGSIQVSTAFANGTDIAADPVAELWLQGQSTSSSTGATSS